MNTRKLICGGSGPNCIALFNLFIGIINDNKGEGLIVDDCDVDVDLEDQSNGEVKSFKVHIEQIVGKSNNDGEGGICIDYESDGEVLEVSLPEPFVTMTVQASIDMTRQELEEYFHTPKTHHWAISEHQRRFVGAFGNLNYKNPSEGFRKEMMEVDHEFDVEEGMIILFILDTKD
jgi:hypothetical protein